MTDYAYRKRTLRLIAGIIDSAGKLFFRQKKELPAVAEKILVVKLDHLGDCFLMTPLFFHLRRKYRNAVIDVVCLESSAGIFKGNPDVNNIIIYNKPGSTREPYKPAASEDFWNLVSLLKKEKYDLFIEPRGDFTAALMGYKSGARFRIGFEKEETGGFLYTTRLRYDRLRHEIEKYFILLHGLGITSEEWRPVIYPSDEETASVREKTASVKKPFAVIHPGAGLPYKVWPEERWAGVASYLFEKGYEIIFTGGKEDVEKTEEIISHIKGKESIYNFAGSLSIRETYYLISSSSLFVGNDSVLGHFAGACGIPTLVLMNSAVDPVRWKPMGEKVKVLTGKDKNHICALDECAYPCPNMTAITEETVIKTLEGLL